jgi:hypothetical protein
MGVMRASTGHSSQSLNSDNSGDVELGVNGIRRKTLNNPSKYSPEIFSDGVHHTGVVIERRASLPGFLYLI